MGFHYRPEKWEDAKRVANQGLALPSVARIVGVSYDALLHQRRRNPEGWPPLLRKPPGGHRDCSNCDVRRMCSQWFCVCEHYRPWGAKTHGGHRRRP